MFCTELDLNRKKKCKNIEQMMTSCVSGAECNKMPEIFSISKQYFKYFKYFQRRPGREQTGPGEAGPGGAVRSRHLSGLPGQPCGPGHFLQSTTIQY